MKLRNSILALISIFAFAESVSAKDCNILASEMVVGSDVNCVIAGTHGQVLFRGTVESSYPSVRLRGSGKSAAYDFNGEFSIDLNDNTVSDYDGTFSYKSEHPLFSLGVASVKGQMQELVTYGKWRWEFQNGAVLIGTMRDYSLFDGKIELTLTNHIKITGQIDGNKPYGYATLTNLANGKSISIESTPFISIWDKLGYFNCSEYCSPTGAYDADTEAQLTSSLWKLAEKRIAKEQELAEKRRKALLAMKPVTCGELIGAVNANEVRARRDYPQDQIRIKGIATDINVTSRSQGQDVAVVEIQEREDFFNGCSAYMDSFDEAVEIDKNQSFDFVCETWNESSGNVAFENCRLMKNAIK